MPWLPALTLMFNKVIREPVIHPDVQTNPRGFDQIGQLGPWQRLDLKVYQVMQCIVSLEPPKPKTTRTDHFFGTQIVTVP